MTSLSYEYHYDFPHYLLFIVIIKVATPLAGPTVYYNAHFGAAPSSTPIFLQQLLCTSFETRLVDCSHPGVGQIPSSCGHDDDAGVRCRTCKELGAVSFVDTMSSARKLANSPTCQLECGAEFVFNLVPANV